MLWAKEIPCDIYSLIFWEVEIWALFLGTLNLQGFCCKVSYIEELI